MSKRLMVNKLKSALAGLMLMLFPVTALAWNDPSHIVIGYIAYSRLNATARAKVEAAAGRIDYRGQKYNRITIATYMDDVRGDPFYDYLRPLHYILLRNEDDLKTLANPEATGRGNILTQLNKTIDSLRAKKGEEVGEDEALLLAYLIHLVGDAHQPLHCADIISDERPEGDAGGNLFFIDGKTRSLHSYWDSAAEMFSLTPIKISLDSAGYEKVGNYSFEVIKNHPLKEKDLENFGTPESWVKESFEIARDYVYVNVRENAPLSDEYQKMARRVTGERLALAGYRLAALLNDIYPVPTLPAEPVRQLPQRQEPPQPEPQPTPQHQQQPTSPPQQHQQQSQQPPRTAKGSVANNFLQRIMKGCPSGGSFRVL